MSGAQTSQEPDLDRSPSAVPEIFTPVRNSGAQAAAGGSSGRRRGSSGRKRTPAKAAKVKTPREATPAPHTGRVTGAQAQQQRRRRRRPLRELLGPGAAVGQQRKRRASPGRRGSGAGAGADAADELERFREYIDEVDATELAVDEE